MDSATHSAPALSKHAPSAVRPAPIALFAYNRLFHIQQTVEALRRNDLAGESDLFVFSDGPRDGGSEPVVQQVRSYLRTVAGFRTVQIVKRKENLGLANSITRGVGEVVRRSGCAIVLEDDMVTSPYFLRYMNEGLAQYRDDDRVISIHGYTLPVIESLPETFFMRGTDCWGWGTWERGWSLFEPDGARLLQEIHRRELSHLFDFNGSYPYTKMLRDQISGRNNSWAIRWYATAFLANKLTLYPGTSLVRNIGNEGSGSHGCKNDSFYTQLSRRPIRVGQIDVVHNEDAFAACSRLLGSSKRIRFKQTVHTVVDHVKQLWKKPIRANS